MATERRPTPTYLGPQRSTLIPPRMRNQLTVLKIPVNHYHTSMVASCFIDPTFRVDLNPTTLTDGHGSRQHFQPCDLPREFTGVCVVWFGRSPPYHFQW
ncbi:MAG: hypothetical protein NWE87_00100 [Candidatus Bathyarchaeota archaeon]|nr:hypothetical protein [Candidatus Bathyarchaeota archaeon]